MERYIIIIDQKTQFVKMSRLIKLIYRYMSFQLKFMQTYVSVEVDEYVYENAKDREYSGQP